MKKKTHPKYYEETEIKCACGNTFKVGSTVEKIDIEICNECHPYYTGKEKLIDSTGRVDRFKQRMQKMEDMKAKEVKSKKAKAPKKEIAKDASEETTKKTEDKK